jgi:predicted DsbA family dithiol-disulfide isomerase
VDAGVADTDDGPLAIDVYSDFLCPWCYVASARVRWLADDPRVALTLLPYELHPGVPTSGRTTVDVYGRGDTGRAERALGRFAALAADEGLPWRSPTRVPNTRALLGIDEWLRRHAPEVRRRYHEGVFAALWVDDLDLSDADVVADLVGAAGGPVDEAVAGGRSPEAMAWLDEHRRTATERGVGGTPAFVIGELVIPGLQDRSLFERMIERMMSRRDR